MELIYLCPFCRGAINAKRNIILSVRSSDNQVGLALLHEEIGNYAVALSPTINVDTGDIVDFFCPICHAELNTSKGDNLARYVRVDDTGSESSVIISREYGERCTFTVDDRKKSKNLWRECEKIPRSGVVFIMEFMMLF